MIEEYMIIDEYAKQETWRIRANANYNFSFSGLQSHVAGTVLAKHALEKFGKYGKKHLDGFYHLHNLDGGVYGRYCNGNDLIMLLQKGLYNPAGASSKPARHLGTALDHMANFIYIMTGEFQGAQAFSHVDILMAPYIWKDKLTYEKVRQEIQQMVWSLAYPLRPGFQTPFVNITFGLRPSKYFKELIPFVGNEQLKDCTYDDFQEEIDMFNRAFLEVMIEGTGKGDGFTFPLPTYNITKDFKWNNVSDENSIEYLIFKLASEWGSPYFANYIGSGMNEDDAFSMCCRLRLDLNEIYKASGGIWNFGNNTGSLAVCTINMSRLGYLSNGNEKKFYELLNAQLDDAKNYLLMKKKYIKEGAELGLFPMTNEYVSENLFKTYFLTIGINGLNECSVNFCDLNIMENEKWCEEVLSYINNKVKIIQIESGELFNFEATPAEGCSYTLAKLDKERYCNIFIQGDEKEPYYTGSSMIPMNMDINIINAFEHQNKLQKHYTGGSIFHIDIGETGSPGGISDLIRGICENTQLPYLTWSPSYAICPVHGKLFGKQSCCEKAKEWTRVVGFYRPVDNFNIGKRREFEDKKFLKWK